MNRLFKHLMPLQDTSGNFEDAITLLSINESGFEKLKSAVTYAETNSINSIDVEPFCSLDEIKEYNSSMDLDNLKDDYYCEFDNLDEHEAEEGGVLPDLEITYSNGNIYVKLPYKNINGCLQTMEKFEISYSDIDAYFDEVDYSKSEKFTRNIAMCDNEEYGLGDAIVVATISKENYTKLAAKISSCKTAGVHEFDISDCIDTSDAYIFSADNYQEILADNGITFDSDDEFNAYMRKYVLNIDELENYNSRLYAIEAKFSHNCIEISADFKDVGGGLVTRYDYDIGLSEIEEFYGKVEASHSVIECPIIKVEIKDTDEWNSLSAIIENTNCGGMLGKHQEIWCDYENFMEATRETKELTKVLKSLEIHSTNAETIAFCLAA